MNYSDWTREVRQRTEPRPEAVARVRGRLDRQLHSTAPELSALPGPTDLQVARVRARLREAGLRDRRVPAWVPAGALLAAAALLAVVTILPEDRPAPIELSLAGAGDAQLGEHVIVHHDGRGSVAGTVRDLEIDWEVGRLELAVTPEQGVALAVRTGEGVVRVVGTEFAVVRDALGTGVEVSHGEVAVECADGARHAVTPGEAAECLPTTAPGWLRRAQAQQDRGHPAADVLASVTSGLAAADATAGIRSELEVTRMGVLHREGLGAEALDAAERALVGADSARAQELHRFAAGVSLAHGDCARALPHLRALAAPTADEAAWRERCAGR